MSSRRNIITGSTLYEKFNISDCTANTFQQTVRHSEALGTYFLLTHTSSSDKSTCPSCTDFKNSDFYLTKRKTANFIFSISFHMITKNEREKNKPVFVIWLRL